MFKYRTLNYWYEHQDEELLTSLFDTAEPIFESWDITSWDLMFIFLREYGHLCISRPYGKANQPDSGNWIQVKQDVELYTKIIKPNLVQYIKMINLNNSIDNPIKIYSINRKGKNTRTPDLTTVSDGSNSDKVTTTPNKITAIQDSSNQTTTPNTTKTTSRSGDEIRITQVTTFEDSTFRNNDKETTTIPTVTESESGTSTTGTSGTRNITESGDEIKDSVGTTKDTTKLTGNEVSDFEETETGTNKYMWEDIIMKQLSIQKTNLIERYLKYIADKILMQVYLFDMHEEERF